MLKTICLAAAWLLMADALAQAPQAETPGSPTSTTPGAIVGLSPCENLIGLERDKCLKAERARTANAGGRSAGAGGTHAPASTGAAPSGATR